MANFMASSSSSSSTVQFHFLEIPLVAHQSKNLTFPKEAFGESKMVYRLQHGLNSGHFFTTMKLRTRFIVTPV